MRQFLAGYLHLPARPIGIGLAAALSVELGGQSILSGIDFEVSPGEVVGLVGRNGVGKTTLLRLANGMIAASEGRILLGDESVATLGRRRLVPGCLLPCCMRRRCLSKARHCGCGAAGVWHAGMCR